MQLSPHQAQLQLRRIYHNTKGSCVTVAPKGDSSLISLCQYHPEEHRLQPQFQLSTPKDQQTKFYRFSFQVEVTKLTLTEYSIFRRHINLFYKSAKNRGGKKKKQTRSTPKLKPAKDMLN